MHVVMRTEQRVPEKSITGTPLRTASSSSAFERTVAMEHAWAVISNVQWLRSIMLHSAVATDRTVATEQARAAISSAQWLLRKREEWFRPHGADRARWSSDFECAVATERA